MKITPEHLQAVTKKIVAENKKLTKKVKETKDEEETLTALDALKELEDLAVDTSEVNLGSDDEDDPNEEPETKPTDSNDDEDADSNDDEDIDSGDDEDLDEVLNLGPRKSSGDTKKGDSDEPTEVKDDETEDGSKKSEDEDEPNEEVEVAEGDESCIVVDISNIEWDTDDFSEEDAAAMGTDEPLWDLPTEIEDAEIPYNKGDDLDDVISEWLSNVYGFTVNGFNFEVKDKVDESLLSDALGSIGNGIKGLLKLCGKGVIVLIAGLGGSFLFGLPGLLLAVMIAFGLMGGTNESASKHEVEEGLGAGIKEKLKNVIGALKKMDKKTLKALNDKAKSGKEGAQEVANMLKSGNIEKVAAEKVAEEGDCCECEVTEDGDDSLFDLVVSQHTAFRNAIGLGAAFKKFVGNDANVTDDNGFDSAGTKDGLWITVSEVKVSGDKVSGKAKVGDGEPQDFEVGIGNLKKVLTDANAVDGFEYHMEDVINAIVKCAGVIKEKHGDKNNKGWRKNRKIREGHDMKEVFNIHYIDNEAALNRGTEENHACDETVEGTLNEILNICAYTAEWGQHSLSDIGEVKDAVDEGDWEWKTDEEAIDVLNSADLGMGSPVIMSITCNGKEVYSSGMDDSQFVETEDEDIDDEDEIDVTEDGDLASKLDELDADELKKLNPEQKEKLQDILTVEDGEEDEPLFESVSTPRQIVRFLRESKTGKTTAVVRHATRRYAKMIKESSPTASRIARALNRKFGRGTVSERKFCQAFTRAVLG